MALIARGPQWGDVELDLLVRITCDALTVQNGS